MHPAPATRIGRYEVLATLGRGAMGVVYQARDPQIDRLVAIKTILWLGDEPEDAQQYRQRFIQEAKAAGRLSHPGIVQIYDVGEDAESKAPFFVMEYVAGQSLNKFLAAMPGAKLPLEHALRLAEEIAEALAYAHSQGVVHRDIKPANILVTEEGRVKIADFGVAKLDFANLTIAGHAVGTPAYMAPEQLAGEHVDGRADLFSLGVILYSMVTGFRPFQGRGNSTIAHKVRHGEPLPVSTIDVRLPAEVDALIAKAMAKNVKDRFQTGADLAKAIRKLRRVDTSSTSSTDFRAVLQETGAHVACMAPERKTTAHGFASQKPALVGTTLLPARLAAHFSSKRALATTLAAAMLAATALAWRVHASLQPQIAPEPVAWETAAPAQTSPELTPVAAQESSPAPLSVAVVPTTPEPKPPVTTAKKATKAKPLANDDDEEVVVRDRTVHLAKASAPIPAMAKPPAVKPAVDDSATLQVALEHAFDEALVTVWVGDRQVLTQTVRGEKKRVLMFQRTRGTFMDKVSVPAGPHLVRVRVQSPTESFDASQSVRGDFVKSSQQVLHARCDKKRKELKLDLEAASLTSSAK